MGPRVTDVQANDDYTITLTCDNGEIRRFDVKPYLEFGIFRDLKDKSMFNTVRPTLGSIAWQNEADFCPDTLYADSVPEPDPDEGMELKSEVINELLERDREVREGKEEYSSTEEVKRRLGE